MKKIETQVTISASPARVWNVLTNFENHPRWNPFIKSISGNLKRGEKLKVSIQPPGGSGMTFEPVVTSVVPQQEFKWLGKLGIKGIFDGEHYFIVKPNGDGTTTLVQGEVFKGILVGLTGKMLDKTGAGFELMNEALKTAAEQAD